MTLLVGQIIIGLVLMYATEKRKISSLMETLFSQYGMLAIAAFIWMLLISFLLYRRRLAKGVQLESLTEKLEHYRVSCIMRWAMLEFGILIVVVLAMIDGNYPLFLVYALGVAIFAFTRPGIDDFKSEYSINF